MNNILIIGNGFDLYHKLPTRYNDFLILAENWDYFFELYNKSNASGNSTDLLKITLDNGRLTKNSLSDYANHKYVFDENEIQYLDKHLTSNVWVKYFLRIRFNGKGWVDFESEIDNVLHLIDNYFEVVSSCIGTNKIISNIVGQSTIDIVKLFFALAQDKYSNFYLGLLNYDKLDLTDIESHRLCLIEKLIDELNVLNECLRIYLSQFILCIKCDLISDQVLHLGSVRLLNFNYTYTYKAVYGNLREAHHPIHGDCINGRMVLGIPDDSFLDKIEYIQFNKYFQRIQKRTGNFYKEWITKPNDVTLSDTPCEVYILGHSLGYSDKGVLQDFFINEWVSKITIFFYDQSSYEDLIINLVKMFGRDFVIDQTGRERIVFEKLKPIRNKNN